MPEGHRSAVTDKLAGPDGTEGAEAQGAAAEVWGPNSRDKRVRPSHHGARKQPSEKSLAALRVGRRPCARRSRALARFPGLAQGRLQLLPVGRVAPLQVVQLLIFLLVQDAQEILQLWETEGFPL